MSVSFIFDMQMMRLVDGLHSGAPRHDEITKRETVQATLKKKKYIPIKLSSSEHLFRRRFWKQSFSTYPPQDN